MLDQTIEATKFLDNQVIYSRLVSYGQLVNSKKNLSDSQLSSKSQATLSFYSSNTAKSTYFSTQKCADYQLIKMNRKSTKIQIISPFGQLTSNWELLHSIQSSLNQYHNQPSLFVNLYPQNQSESMGKQGIEQLVITAKHLLQLVQVLRSEIKHIESLKSNAAATQQKLQQHEQTIRNYERKFSERTKSLVEQNRTLKENYDKIKRVSVQSEENFKHTLSQTKAEAALLRSELNKVQAEKKSLLEVINHIQEQLSSKEDIITRLQKVSKGQEATKCLKEKIEELLQTRTQRKKKQETLLKAQPEGSPLQRLAIKDISALAKLLHFLTPIQIMSLGLANKRIRLFISSQNCTRSLCRSIISVKNRHIKYYHRHIDYFEKLMHKIPEEVVQTAYFRYHILKETAGQHLMQALNASSLIFQGRFEGEQLYSGLPDYNREMPKNLELGPANFLDVDKGIIIDYKQERGQQKALLTKQLEEMYNKIKTSFQLYRADQQSSTLFISNILKHFSRVFVLGKSLYLESQYLQKLNSFLLAELNKWDRMEIDKNLQLQDLRAQLQAQRKLKLFFTDKSIKSQQKALLEQNLKLKYQMKHGKLIDLMNIACSQKDEIVRKNQTLSKANQKLSCQSKQLRKIYDSIREKYNHVIEELVVVKETIVKMNII